MKFLTFAATTLTGVIAISSADARDINMQSIYPSSLPLLGQAGAEMGDRISLLTGDSLTIHFKNPGEIVTPSGVWDAVSTGAIEAAWYSPGFAEGVIPAAPLFTAFPFGPDMVEYSAWWYHGGGRELWNELSAPYNIHSELCAMLVPEASGWFREKINSVTDLKGKKMRAFGLLAAVMQKLGVEAQSMSPADTMSGLNLGTIDAAELSFPAIDKAVGMNEHADYYYFPGWHQQASLIVFMMNKSSWNDLSDRERAAITEVCTANVTRTAAQGEVIQIEPLADLIATGTIVQRWPDDMLAAFEEAWHQVVEEKAAENADFKRVWQSIDSFRANYKKWSDLGHLQ